MNNVYNADDDTGLLGERMGYGRNAALGLLLVCSTSASALDFDFHDLSISWNNRLTLAAGWRIEQRDPALIAKLNLDPNLCDDDDCLSLSGDPAPNQRLVDAPGAFFAHMQDDGNLNYDQGDLIAGLIKLTTDLNMSWHDFNFKARGIAFHDAVNVDFDEYHPFNRQTSNRDCCQEEFSRRGNHVEGLVGQNFELHDLLVSGSWFIGERILSASLGQQKLRWGEANLIALNSLSEINPPDGRRLRQPGMQINELFQPVPMAVVSGDLFPDLGLTGELFYQFGWKPVIADPGGSFLGEIDPLYRDDAYAILALGQFPEDPQGTNRLQDPAAAFLTDTSVTAEVLARDFAHPQDGGQYGLRINWFAENVGTGTEFGFYAMNYHSRLPYLSVFAADQSCLRNEIANTGQAYADAVVNCEGFAAAGGGEPLPIDTLKVFLDYPEDIHMFGLSFNTNLGKWSVAGEYSFRPNLPVQISAPDIIFAGLQPAFPAEDIVIGSSTPLSQGVDLTVPGARNAAPDYTETRYRGNEVQANQLIRGYERLQVDQLTVSGIRILGNSNPLSALIRAEQIIMLIEGGVTHVWDLPPLDQIQFDGSSPNRTHYSGGADGSGQPDGQPDTRSFNPTQQTDAFVTEFSWGYRLLAQLEYNDIAFGVNLKPYLVFQHDVEGFAPSPMQNFIEHRMEWLLGSEWFLGQHVSGRLQYSGFAGSRHNIRRDKDHVSIELSYTF